MSREPGAIHFSMIENAQQSEFCLIDFLRSRHINVAEALESGEMQGKTIVYINPLNYFYFRKLKDIPSEVWYYADGFMMSVVIGRIILRSRLPRQSFDYTGFAHDFFKHCERNKSRCVLAGGTEHELQNFGEKISAEYPDLQIINQVHGFFPVPEILSKIDLNKVNFVVLGLGNIKQESAALLLHGRRSSVSDQFTVLTCGGFISQTAKSSGMHYYPVWFDRLNLRWLYRFVNEPRVISRVLFHYPKFLVVFIFDVFSNRCRGQRTSIGA